MAPVPTPKLPAPMQLAGLKSRLTRGANLESRAGAVGARVDAAHDVIESGIAALEGYAPGLEQYGTDLMDQIKRLSEPSNGCPDGAIVDPTLPPSQDGAASTVGPNGGPRFPNQS